MAIEVTITEQVSADTFRARGTFSGQSAQGRIEGAADVLVKVTGKMAKLTLDSNYGKSYIMGREVVNYVDHAPVPVAKPEPGKKLTFNKVPFNLSK